jgi:HEAT repeat protein
VLALLAGCASDSPRPVRPEYDLRDPSATRRLDAIATVERTRDRGSVPALIELLDDEDDAVRMAAGSALKSMTGHDTGYRAFAPPDERHAHMSRWRAWWGAESARPAGAKDAPARGGAGYTIGGSHVRTP